jgi:hypothetical protein
MFRVPEPEPEPEADPSAEGRRSEAAGGFWLSDSRASAESTRAIRCLFLLAAKLQSRPPSCVSNDLRRSALSAGGFD